MELGAFSVSLAVRDLQASMAFYEKLGFTRSGGDGESYAIMKNGDHLLGLFQGMFEGNILTFNPGWNQQAETLEAFTDVRTIQRALKEAGITLASETDEDAEGPGSIMLADPDGNMILIDQHASG